MSEELVLGIDAGTTGCRAAAFSMDGTKLANHYQEFPSYFPKPDWVEQNSGDWWEAICASTREVMGKLEGKGVISAISVTNQRETIVPVDGSGNQLRPALVWQDRRSTAECDWLENELGEEKIYKITGLTIDPYFSAPKLLWLKIHERELFESAEKNFCLCMIMCFSNLPVNLLLINPTHHARCFLI
jgi:xylulokinase